MLYIGRFEPFIQRNSYSVFVFIAEFFSLLSLQFLYFIFFGIKKLDNVKIKKYEIVRGTIKLKKLLQYHSVCMSVVVVKLKTFIALEINPEFFFLSKFLAIF